MYTILFRIPTYAALQFINKEEKGKKEDFLKYQNIKNFDEKWHFMISYKNSEAFLFTIFIIKKMKMVL